MQAPLPFIKLTSGYEPSDSDLRSPWTVTRTFQYFLPFGSIRKDRPLISERRYCFSCSNAFLHSTSVSDISLSHIINLFSGSNCPNFDPHKAKIGSNSLRWSRTIQPIKKPLNIEFKGFFRFRWITSE